MGGISTKEKPQVHHSLFVLELAFDCLKWSFHIFWLHVGEQGPLVQSPGNIRSIRYSLYVVSKFLFIFVRSPLEPTWRHWV